MAEGQGHHPHPAYGKVYVALIVLTLGSVFLSRFLHEWHYLMIFVIFALATVKALLVALNFMHLRFERVLILSCALVPVLLFALLLFALMPDILVTVKR